MTNRIGIIVLGRVGMVAAEKFISEGYQVFGHDCNPEAIAALQKFDGTYLENPAEVASRVEIIILVLNDSQVIDVFTGAHGILTSTTAKSTVIRLRIPRPPA